jgi:predicted helicase
LNRVDRAEFFQSFDEGHAVQYFYEPFLHAFDPELRKELGVWYTPEEIVRYQVERVDAVLLSELGLADGLADPKVVVLDPCCGTGAYLRTVLRRIAATLHDKGGDALVANDLKKAAMERVFGFEILPAPFIIAHLQLGLELETLGARLSDLSDPPERAGVYLTNALTGWEPPKEKPKQIAFPGFDDERDAAGRVKQEKPILVILGNRRTDLVSRAGHRLFALLSRRKRRRHPSGLAADSASASEGFTARLRRPWAAGGGLAGHGSAGSRRDRRDD